MPSLQLIALVRIAKPILHSTCLRFNKSSCFSTRYDITKEHSSEIASTIKSLLSTSKCGPIMEKKLFGIVQSLNYEVRLWFQNHTYFIVDHDMYFFEMLEWYSFGLIDTFETAEELILHEDLDIEKRFVIACEYFFDEHFNTLWDNMRVRQRKKVYKQNILIPCMEFRLKKLRRKVEFDSLDMFQSRDCTKYFTSNYVGLLYYFNELDSKERYLCLLKGLKNASIHHFDLYLCFCLMDLEEIRFLLINVDTATSIDIVKLFLQFPFQYYSMDILAPFWRHISDFVFRNVLDFIIHERIETGWCDVDYKKLMKYIWFKSPEGHRLRFRKDILYDKFESILWPPPSEKVKKLK